MPKSDHCEFRKWKACDRCDFDYPLQELQKQNGLDVCSTCYDEEDPAKPVKHKQPRTGVIMKQQPN